MRCALCDVCAGLHRNASHRIATRVINRCSDARLHKHTRVILAAYGHDTKRFDGWDFYFVSTSTFPACEPPQSACGMRCSAPLNRSTFCATHSIVLTFPQNDTRQCAHSIIKTTDSITQRYARPPKKFPVNYCLHSSKVSKRCHHKAYANARALSLKQLQPVSRQPRSITCHSEQFDSIISSFNVETIIILSHPNRLRCWPVARSRTRRRQRRHCAHTQTPLAVLFNAIHIAQHAVHGAFEAPRTRQQSNRTQPTTRCTTAIRALFIPHSVDVGGNDNVKDSSQRYCGCALWYVRMFGCPLRRQQVTIKIRFPLCVRLYS